VGMAGSLTSNLARWPSFHPPTDSDSAALNEAYNETQKTGQADAYFTFKRSWVRKSMPRHVIATEVYTVHFCSPVVC